MPPMPCDPDAAAERRKRRNIATSGVDIGHAPDEPETDLRARRSVCYRCPAQS